jgi:hypothetical protein
MRMGLAVLLNSLLILSVPAPLVAKAKIVKITIKGADLKAPIEISDPKIFDLSVVRKNFLRCRAPQHVVHM